MPALRVMKDSSHIKAYTPLQAAAILVYEMSHLNWQATHRRSFGYPFEELNLVAGGTLQPRRRQKTVSASSGTGIKQKPQ